jgi:hypothetical protein
MLQALLFLTSVMQLMRASALQYLTSVMRIWPFEWHGAKDNVALFLEETQAQCTSD